MEQQKVALVEALARKGSAMCRIYTITNATHSKGEGGDAQEQLCTPASSTVSLDNIDKVWRDVLRITDTNDAKVCLSSKLPRPIKNISIYSVPVTGPLS
jgi:hypothetical protein